MSLMPFIQKRHLIWFPHRLWQHWEQMLRLPLPVPSSDHWLCVTACSTQLTAILFDRDRVNFHFSSYLKTRIQIDVFHYQYLGKGLLLTAFQELFQTVMMGGKTTHTAMGASQPSEQLHRFFSKAGMLQLSDLSNSFKCAKESGSPKLCSSQLQSRKPYWELPSPQHTW